MKQKETVRFRLKHKGTGLYFDGYKSLVADKRDATVLTNPNGFDSYPHEDFFVVDEIGFLMEETSSIFKWEQKKNPQGVDWWCTHIPLSEFEKETFVSYGEPKYIIQKSGTFNATGRCWTREEMDDFISLQCRVDENANFNVIECE